jgi:rod shape-determining protein MreB and related proteins
LQELYLVWINKLLGPLSDPDIAIDLGTANTRLFAAGKGIFCDEPTIVPAWESLSKRVASETETGSETESHEGYVAPLSGGVIADVRAAAVLLERFLQRSRKYGLVGPRAIACAPSDASAGERAALIEAVRKAGVSTVKVIPEPLAAAIGAGLDISSPYAQGLIDIGAGVTDIAIIRSGAIIRKFAVRLACNDMQSAVRRMVSSRYGLTISFVEAERLAKTAGSVGGRAAKTEELTVEGRDRADGRRTEVAVASVDVSQAMAPVVEGIMETIRRAIRSLPPDISAEVIESGICLTGGGACIIGMPEYVSMQTSLEVNAAPDPLHSVIDGASRMLSVAKSTNLWH